MKLHLPLRLRKALLACCTVLGTLSASLATAPLTMAADSSADSTVGFDYSVFNGWTNIYQWTGKSGDTNYSICYGYWYNVSYDATDDKLVVSDTPLGTEGSSAGFAQYVGCGTNSPTVFLLDSESDKDANRKAYYDASGLKFSGIIVTHDSGIDELSGATNEGEVTDGDRTLTIGDSNLEKNYTVIEKDFKLSLAKSYSDNSSKTAKSTKLTLQGKQEWYVAKGATFSLEIPTHKNTSTKSIQAEGNLDLTLTGGGTVEFLNDITFKSGANVTVSSGTLKFADTCNTITFEGLTGTKEGDVTQYTLFTLGADCTVEGITNDSAALKELLDINGVLENGNEWSYANGILTVTETAKDLFWNIDGSKDNIWQDGDALNWGSSNTFNNGDNAIFNGEGESITVSGDVIATSATVTGTNWEWTGDGNLTVEELTVGDGTATSTLTISATSSKNFINGITVTENATLVVKNVDDWTGKVSGAGTLELNGIGTWQLNACDTAQNERKSIIGILIDKTGGDNKLNKLVLSNGTILNGNSSTGNVDRFSNIGIVQVIDGACFATSANVFAVNTATVLHIAGDGIGADAAGSDIWKASALSLGNLFGANGGSVSLNAAIKLDDDASIYVGSPKVTGIISNTITSNGHTLTKTGGGLLAICNALTDEFNFNIQAGKLLFDGDAVTGTGSASIAEGATFEIKGRTDSAWKEIKLKKVEMATNSILSLHNYKNQEIEALTVTGSGAEIQLKASAAANINTLNVGTESSVSVTGETGASAQIGTLTLAGGTAALATQTAIDKLLISTESDTAQITAGASLTLAAIEVDCTGWTNISDGKTYTLGTVSGDGSFAWEAEATKSITGLGDAGYTGSIEITETGDLVLTIATNKINTAYWDNDKGTNWATASWKGEDGNTGYITEESTAVFSGAGTATEPEVVSLSSGDTQVAGIWVKDGSYSLDPATGTDTLTVNGELQINAGASLKSEAAMEVETLNNSGTLRAEGGITINGDSGYTQTTGTLETTQLTVSGKPFALTGGSVKGTNANRALEINGATIGGTALDNVVLKNSTITQTIQNSGMVTISEAVTVDLATLSGYTKDEAASNLQYSETTDTGTEYGFSKGKATYLLVNDSDKFEMEDGTKIDFTNGTEGSTATMAEGNNAAFVVEDTQWSKDFYIGSGVEYEYSAPLTNADGEEATSIILDGGKIQLSTELTQEQFIAVQAASEIEITDSGVLAQNTLSGATETNNVALSGNGVYDIGSSVEMDDGISLSDEWSGIVQTNAEITNGDLTQLTKGQKSTVSVGSINTDTLTANGNVISAGAVTLTGTDSHVKAGLTIKDNNSLVLGSQATAANLKVDGLLSTDSITLAHAGSQIQAGGLTTAGAVFSVIINDAAVLEALNNNALGGNDITLVTLDNAYTGTAELVNKSRNASSGTKFITSLKWINGGLELIYTATANENYMKEKFSGGSANGMAGATLMDEAFAGGGIGDDGDLADIMNAVDNGGMTDEHMAAVAGSSTAALGMAFAGDVERQLRAIRNRTTTMGVNQCVVNEGMPYFNAWVNAEGNMGELDKDGTYAGYKLDNWGGTVGFDVDVNPNLTLGLAVTAMYGDLTVDGPDMLDGDMDTYYVTAFARYSKRAWTHTFIGTIGKMDGSYERTVNHAGGSYTAEGDTDGLAFGLMYEVGRVYALTEDGNTCLQPVFNVAYRHTTVNGYTEKGGNAALDVDDQTLDTITLGAGARMQAVVGENLYNRTSVLELRALAKLDIGDRASEADVAFIGGGSRATVESAEPGAFGVELGAGLSIPVGDENDGTLFFDVSAEFRSGYSDLNGTVGYRINF